MLSIYVLTMEVFMVQKIDKKTTDSKRTINNPNDESLKNSSQQMNKHSHKTNKNAPKTFDPSGLPKYR